MDMQLREVWENERVPKHAKRGTFSASLTEELLVEAVNMGCYVEMGQTEFLRRLIELAKRHGGVRDIE